MVKFLLLMEDINMNINICVIDAGRIDFKDERLEDIMTTLSHWYDFEVKYANDAVKDLRFGCSVNRYETIEPFIDHMVKTGKVSVKKNNNCYLFINN